MLDIDELCPNNYDKLQGVLPSTLCGLCARSFVKF